MSRKRIYLDNTSTTPLDPRVLKAMLPYFSEKFGNPSSIHAEGVIAKNALESSRKSVAGILQCRKEEIIFTSGGTESNNLGIFGVVKALEKNGLSISKMHFVTTNIEHASVLECFRELKARGARVDYAPVGENGVVKAETVGALLKPETVLVSVGLANNEIGTIQPVREISKIIRAHNLKNFKPARMVPVGFGAGGLSNFQTCFHSDGSQAQLYLNCSPSRLGVDLLTLDGHKMYGPKGVGALYVKRNTPLSPIIFGGGQERGVRSTTENVPAIAGFAKAFEIVTAEREKESARLTKLRDYFYSNLLQNIGIEVTKEGEKGKNGRKSDRMSGQFKRVVINGDLWERLPNNINISLPGLDTEFLLLKLDAVGIACSTKSSCLGSEGGSYVVRAIGGGEERANSTLRFSLGRHTTKKDVDFLLKCLHKIAPKYFVNNQ